MTVASGAAAYEGVFLAVSSYNNAGFALYSDSLIGFATDPFVCLPIAAAVVVGGLGIPVLLELRRELRTPKTWSVHTKIALLGSALLLVGGWATFTAFEWRNPATLGPLGHAGQVAGRTFPGWRAAPNSRLQRHRLRPGERDESARHGYP